MNDLVKLALASSQKRGLNWIVTKDRAPQAKTDLIAGLILSGPLFVVSGDEWLPSFDLARIIRSKTTQIKEVMSRLRSTRASTCYRLWDSLATIPSKGEPILVLELLHTFYDADIPLRVRHFRLRKCCRELERLSFHRPVVVMTRQMEGEEYEQFILTLSPITDRTLSLEAELEPVEQPALF